MLSKEELSELKSLVTVNIHFTQVANIFLSLISRHSEFTKLQTILAWCFCIISNFKNYKSKGYISSLTTAELKKSMKMIVKFTQTHYIGSEISQVEHVYPGSDNVVRVVTLRTANGQTPWSPVVSGLSFTNKLSNKSFMALNNMVFCNIVLFKLY